MALLIAFLVMGRRVSCTWISFLSVLDRMLSVVGRAIVTLGPDDPGPDDRAPEDMSKVNVVQEPCRSTLPATGKETMTMNGKGMTA